MSDKEIVLANCSSCFPSYSNSLPIPHKKMSSMCSNLMLNLTSFKAPWSVTHYIAPSTASPLEVGLIAGSESPVSADTSGEPRMNCVDTRLVLMGTRVCITLELLNCTLEDLHGAYQGIDRMKAQAREAVYWPRIDADIVDYSYVDLSFCWLIFRTSTFFSFTEHRQAFTSSGLRTTKQQCPYMCC